MRISFKDRLLLLMYRLFAMSYDLLLLLGIWLFTLAIITIINKGEAVLHPFVSIILLTEWLAYYLYFLGRAGRTPGMLAWRLFIDTDEEKPITWVQLLIRFFFGVFSFIVIWLILIHRKGYALQDILSKTSLYRQ